jgi:spoIIIJ-associated protein
MENSVEIQAKTIDGAIEQALAELHASYEEVDVEILQTGGIFKKPKVRVTIKEGIRKTPAGTQNNEINTHESNEAKSSDRINPESTTPNPKSKPTPKPKPAKTTAADRPGPNTHGSRPADSSPGSPPRDPSEWPLKFTKSLAFTETLLELLQSGAKVTPAETERSFNLNITGENVGMIIGKGGDVLNAIQTLVSSVAIANAGGEHKRVYVNVEDYKERREQTLKTLAVKKAERVKETGRYIKLEPMNARERAIIHSALQDVAGIRTYSTGKDPHRCLCIAPANEK